MRTRLVNPVFVARGRELGRTSDALARAVASEPSVLLVAGEGKDGRDLGCADDRPRAIPANGSVAGVARRPLARTPSRTPQSPAEDGFAAGRRVPAPSDDEKGPTLVFADLTQST